MSRVVGSPKDINAEERPSNVLRSVKRPGGGGVFGSLALISTVEAVEVLVGCSLRPLLIGRLLAATITTGARGCGIAHRGLATIRGR